MSDLYQATIRSTAFLRKELVEVLRQPQLVLTLVLGPFLILLLFGAGLGDLAPSVRTLFVAPEGSAGAELAEGFTAPLGSRIDVLGVTSELDEGLQRLRGGEVDLVVSIPDDAGERFRADQQSTVVLYHDYIDPIETRALVLALGRTVGAINDQLVRSLVAQGQEDTGAVLARTAAARDAATLLRQEVESEDAAAVARRLTQLAQAVDAVEQELGVGAAASGAIGEALEDDTPETAPPRLLDALQQRIAGLTGAEELTVEDVEDLEAELARIERGLQEFVSLSPEVIVSPFRGVTQGVGVDLVQLSDFYAPAVVALLLQHMVVTLVSLSVVREQQLGTTELFRVAPLSSAELLIGKSLAALLLSGAIAVVLVGALILTLGVPLQGSAWWLAAAIFGVLLASTGLGFVVALLARTDSQAVQYAMLALLASIFLCGFVLTLEYFLPPLQVLARFLPATYGIELLRDLMLRGVVAWQALVALGVMAAVLFTASWLLLRRRMSGS